MTVAITMETYGEIKDLPTVCGLFSLASHKLQISLFHSPAIFEQTWFKPEDMFEFIAKYLKVLQRFTILALVKLL